MRTERAAQKITKDNLNISTDDFRLLKKVPIDLFFHIAALMDFRSDASVKAKLEEVNVRGTLLWLQLHLVWNDCRFCVAFIFQPLSTKLPKGKAFGHLIAVVTGRNF